MSSIPLLDFIPIPNQPNSKEDMHCEWENENQPAIANPLTNHSIYSRKRHPIHSSHEMDNANPLENKQILDFLETNLDSLLDELNKARISNENDLYGVIEAIMQQYQSQDNDQIMMIVGIAFYNELIIAMVCVFDYINLFSKNVIFNGIQISFPWIFQR